MKWCELPPRIRDSIHWLAGTGVIKNLLGFSVADPDTGSSAFLTPGSGYSEWKIFEYGIRNTGFGCLLTCYFVEGVGDSR